VNLPDVLGSLDGPDALRRLDAEELDALATQIRRELVETVATTGGHLGSNLGVVELTIALHRVFDSPRDAIIFDTGHQAYVHKLLTGRRSRFPTLRQRHGLSGYPSRAESEHDWIENSHASTALSYAFGVAHAWRLRPDEAAAAGRVVAVVGDGALTGGLAFEALNNIGYHRVPLVIVLNDNGRSYAPTISRLGESLSPLDVNPLAARRADELREALASLALAPDQLDRAEAALAGLRRVDTFFDALGVGYSGPVDGHDCFALEAALRKAAEASEPSVVHVLTRKGRGYPPAEDDDEKCLHDVTRFDVRRGPRSGGASAHKYTDVFGDAIVAAGRDDDRVCVLTAAMPGSTGLLGFRNAFPERCFDVGIAEQHAVTAAAGLALGGARPVVAVYSTFLSRAVDQINLDVGLHHLPVVFCVDRAGVTGPDGPSHHGLLDLVLLTKIPGMTVLAPSSAAELEVMLRDALWRIDGPCALRWPNARAPETTNGAAGEGLEARRLRDGGDVCLLALGRMVETARCAAEQLTTGGVSVTVWDIRVAAPLDRGMIEDAARHDVVVTVEDGMRAGGVGMAIADAIGAVPRAREAPIVRVLGAPTAYLPHGDPDGLLAEIGLDASGVAAAALDALSGRVAARV
jgi:1-deoxy-D-xylulose-5-phosphate synthase